jgi:phosphate starvation-inducible PhoH-like protein
MRFEKKLNRKEKRANKFDRIESSPSHNQNENGYAVKAPTAMNQSQQQYLNSIYANIITFGIGCAGTGKSYLALSYAAQQLQLKNVSKIIISRPLVEAGESLGYLKGELSDKTEPWMLPMIEILNKRLGKTSTEYYLNKKIIEFKPLAYLRGTTFNDAVVILDEAQNTTPKQLEMFLTRIGDEGNIKVIIDGDYRGQKDIQGFSGLEDAVMRLKGLESEGIGFCYFDIEDVVRSGICKSILKAYRN